MIIKRITLLCTFLAWATSSIAQITAFQHVVLVIQENRTPDNLFHALCATHPCSTTPGVGQYNIQTTGWLDKTAPGGKRTPTAAPFAGTYDLSHGPRGWRALCDKVDGVCKMDGAANTPCIFGTCPPHAALTYVDNTSGVLNPYLDLVGSYGWGNYFFCTQQSSSYPAHQFIFGATSADTATDDHDGYFVASSTKAANDCNNLGNVVPVIGPAGAVTKYVAPCYVRTTLSDFLETKGITWRYYGSNAPGSWRDPGIAGIWMAPNSIDHICMSNGVACTGAEWRNNVTVVPSQVLADISTPKCNLAGVSWVIPDSQDSDHIRSLSNTGGPSWVASIVNAIGSSTCKNPDGSSYWDTTAIIVTWDDWGGFYDHEPPTIEAAPQGGFQMGPRVPLVVVSAYTPAGFISNKREDFGSMIRFVEKNFGITEGALTFADARASTDLTEFFQLTRAPRRFHTIKAPLSAKYFLTRKPSSEPVDDD